MKNADVRLPLADLVWPHRLDIAARVEALELYDRVGPDGARASSYASLVELAREIGLRDHVGDVDSLIALYERARGNKSVIQSGLTVFRQPSPSPVLWPLDGTTVTQATSSLYALRDSADAVAVLLHMGEDSALFTVERQRNGKAQVFDYTTLMAAYRITVASSRARRALPWPTLPPEIALIPDLGDGATPEAERFRKIVVARGVQLEQYERRISRLFEVFAADVSPQPNSWASRLRERLGLMLGRLGRRIRRALGILKRLVLNPGGTLSQARGWTGVVRTSMREKRERSAKRTSEPTAFHFSPRELQLRKEQQLRFARSGELARLEKFRGAFEGQRCFIVGNGPSLKEQDLTLLADEQVFVTNWFVNHPDFEKVRPNYYCISSHEVFGGWYKDLVPSLDEGLKAALQERAPKVKPDFFFSFRFREYLQRTDPLPDCDLYYLLFERPKASIPQRGRMNVNLAEHRDDGHTGLLTFAFPLARFMGFKKIYLLGCDSDYGLTSPEAEKKYFYDFSRHTSRTTSYEGLMRAWSDGGPAFQAYEIARQQFEEEGIEIVNLTRGGRLEVFPRAVYEEVMG